MLPFHGMRTLRPILLALTAVAALSVAYPAKANLITNPGFETGNLSGWTLTAGFLPRGHVLGRLAAFRKLSSGGFGGWSSWAVSRDDSGPIIYRRFLGRHEDRGSASSFGGFNHLFGGQRAIPSWRLLSPPQAPLHQ